jgi:hypothetical protein
MRERPWTSPPPVTATLVELIIEEAGYGQVFLAQAPIPVSPNILQVNLTHDCVVENPPPTLVPCTWVIASWVMTDKAPIG